MVWPEDQADVHRDEVQICNHQGNTLARMHDRLSVIIMLDWELVLTYPHQYLAGMFDRVEISQLTHPKFFRRTRDIVEIFLGGYPLSFRFCKFPPSKNGHFGADGILSHKTGKNLACICPASCFFDPIEYLFLGQGVLSTDRELVVFAIREVLN